MLSGTSEQLVQLAYDNDCPEAEAYLSSLEHAPAGQRLVTAKKFVNFLIAHGVVDIDERGGLLGEDGLTHDNPFQEVEQTVIDEFNADDSLISNDLEE